MADIAGIRQAQKKRVEESAWAKYNAWYQAGLRGLKASPERLTKNELTYIYTKIQHISTQYAYVRGKLELLHRKVLVDKGLQYKFKVKYGNEDITLGKLKSMYVGAIKALFKFLRAASAVDQQRPRKNVAGFSGSFGVKPVQWNEALIDFLLRNLPATEITAIQANINRLPISDVPINSCGATTNLGALISEGYLPSMFTRSLLSRIKKSQGNALDYDQYLDRIEDFLNRPGAQPWFDQFVGLREFLLQDIQIIDHKKDAIDLRSVASLRGNDTIVYRGSIYRLLPGRGAIGWTVYQSGKTMLFRSANGAIYKKSDLQLKGRKIKSRSSEDYIDDEISVDQTDANIIYRNGAKHVYNAELSRENMRAYQSVDSLAAIIFLHNGHYHKTTSVTSVQSPLTRMSNYILSSSAIRGNDGKHIGAMFDFTSPDVPDGIKVLNFVKYKDLLADNRISDADKARLRNFARIYVEITKEKKAFKAISKTRREEEGLEFKYIGNYDRACVEVANVQSEDVKAYIFTHIVFALLSDIVTSDKVEG